MKIKEFYEQIEFKNNNNCYYLEKEGYSVVLTREPGGVSIAENIRNIIVDVNNTNMDPKTEALLYAASRRQHLVEKVIPALEQGYMSEGIEPYIKDFQHKPSYASFSLNKPKLNVVDMPELFKNGFFNVVTQC